MEKQETAMRRWIVMGLFTVLLASASGVQAGFYTGNDLYEKCQKDREFCSYYAAGVTDVFTDVGIRGSFCFPEGVTRKQIADILFNFMDKHPEKRHFAGPSLTLLAMQESFPCKKF